MGYDPVIFVSICLTFIKIFDNIHNPVQFPAGMLSYIIPKHKIIILYFCSCYFKRII